VSNDVTQNNRVFHEVLPDIARLSQDIHDSRRASPFLRRLTSSAGSPCEYHTVAREAACDVQEAGEVPRGHAQSLQLR
jgi:hypothetical protein